MSYTVEAERDGRSWLVRVPAVGRATQARSVDEVDVMARELIELMTGETDVELEVEFQLPKSVREHLAKAERAKLAEIEARQTAAAEMRAAAKDLRERKLSYKDVGAVLNVSHQRAHQLVNG